MLLAFSTLPCMDSSSKELKDICDKFGFSAAEVRVNEDNTFVCGNELNVSNLGSSICIKKYDKQQIECAVNLFKKAEAAGIGAVRIFLGNFCRTYDAPKEPVVHSEIIQALREICDNTGIEVWIETHNEYATGRSLKKLLDDVGRDNIKIIWDIIHPIEDGEAPEDTISYLGGRIAHIHIKDGRKSEDKNQHDYIYTRLGEGELPIRKIVTLLIENGYDGYYSLEWESLWRDELKAIRITNEELFTEYVELMKSIIS